MLYKGCFIARIPNDEHARSKIAMYKKKHGQLKMYGRHKDRKGAMEAVGRKLNTHGDLPWWLGTEIVIHRGESGMTFKQFHRAEEKSNTVFKTKNFDPFKIMVLVFVVVFIFVFSKGIEVLTSPNPSSYSIPYDGPSKSVFEKWLPFSKGK